MQAAIIAGGMGTRLGELAKNKPKSMVKIQNKPFLEYQLEFLRKGGVEDIVLCLGHLGKQIEDYFGSGSKFRVRIKYSYENSPLDTAGALKQAESLLDSEFFTLYGDSYIFLDFPEVTSYFRTRRKLGLMTVYQNQDNFDRSNTAIKDGMVVKYSKQEKTTDTVFIDYGANLLRKEVLTLVPGLKSYSLGTLFQQLIAQKELLAYEVKERFYEIGSLSGLSEFEQYLKESR